MTEFIEMLSNDNFVSYLNNLGKWIIEQDYGVLDSVYKSWASDEATKQFLLEKVSEKSYTNLFVGKFFIPDETDNAVDRLLSKSTKQVGDTFVRSDRLMHNWTKNKSVAVDFSRVNRNPKHPNMSGFISKIPENINPSFVVVDCNRLITFIRGELRNAAVMKIAREKKIHFLLDIASGNDMLEGEQEVFVIGKFKEATVLATWKCYAENGKVHTETKGNW